MMYRIESVTDKNGADYTDEIHNGILGATGFIFGILEEDMSLLFIRVDPETHSQYTGIINTSKISSWTGELGDQELQIHTRNSIYTLRWADPPRKRKLNKRKA